MSIAAKHQIIHDYIVAELFSDIEEQDYLAKLFWLHFRQPITRFC